MFFDAVNSLAPSSPTIPTQLSTAMAFGYILNAVRRSEKIPWVNHQTTMLAGIIRAAMAGAATLGISIQWSSVSHTLTIGNLTAGVIAAGLWHWLSQYAAQHGFEQLLQIKQAMAPAPVVPPPANG